MDERGVDVKSVDNRISENIAGDGSILENRRLVEFKLGEWLLHRPEHYNLVSKGVSLPEVGSETAKKKDKPKIFGKKKTKPSGIFGQSLENLSQTTGICIPYILVNCIHFLCSNGIRVSGIFRISASHSQIQLLKDQYIDPSVNLDLSKCSDDPHAVAALLKNFFATLPEPLFTFDAYEPLVAAYRLHSEENNLPEAKKQISQILRNLPECHAIPLRLLFQFLSHVSSLSNINFMTQRNLAICFGPSVLRSCSDDPLKMMDHVLRSCSDDPLKMMDQYDSKICELVIEHYGELFGEIGREFSRKQSLMIKQLDQPKKKPESGLKVSMSVASALAAMSDNRDRAHTSWQPKSQSNVEVSGSTNKPPPFITRKSRAVTLEFSDIPNPIIQSAKKDQEEEKEKGKGKDKKLRLSSSFSVQVETGGREENEVSSARKKSDRKKRRPRRLSDMKSLSSSQDKGEEESLSLLDLPEDEKEGREKRKKKKREKKEGEEGEGEERRKKKKEERGEEGEKKKKRRKEKKGEEKGEEKKERKKKKKKEEKLKEKISDS